MSLTQTLSATEATPPAAPGTDFSVIGLVSLAHGTSHFFHMLLPPLFPAFIRDFGVSYSQLGLLVTLFFAISGVGQALGGFLVDRVGARPVLFVALGCFALSAVVASLAQGLGGLMMAAALAGLGNAPFHPADFTILNKRVAVSRLGHAFSLHSISGNLGWAVAPLFMLGVAGWAGSWRVACLAAGAWALLVLATLVLRRDVLDDRLGAWASSVARPGMATGTATEHPMAFLRLPSVWLCFSFFFWSTAALTAIQSFAAPALAGLYGMPLTTTAFVVTGYMAFGIAGMLAGGFLASRTQRLERSIGLALSAAALALLLVATGWLPGWLALVLAAAAGMGTGLAGPSRDMLIRQAAPPGATGRVYGTVYSGLDVGFALSAPAFGWLLDHGWRGGVFAAAAATLMMGVLSAAWVALRVRSDARRAATAGNPGLARS
jgi:MFS transporter, FSR family, fosmidomycin resistance protein